MIRPRVLVALFALVASAIFFAPDATNEDIVEAQKSSPSDVVVTKLNSDAPALTDTSLKLTPRAQTTEPIRDLFEYRLVSTTKVVGTTVVQPKTPPPAPIFSAMGKILVDGKWLVYLSDGTKTLSIRDGERLDERFVVRRIAPPTLLLSDQLADTTISIDIGL